MVRPRDRIYRRLGLEHTVMVMRLRCACGRNLADVRPSGSNRDFVNATNNPRGELSFEEAERRNGPGVYLMVVPRAQVEFAEYRHEVLDRRLTYRLRCVRKIQRDDYRGSPRDDGPPACGADWQISSVRVAETWTRLIVATRDGSGAIAVLGRDL